MFIVKTAFRYIFSKNHGQRTNTILSIIGIGLSILAVIVVISIMNGLQTTQLERLKDVESFDLIVNNSTLSKEVFLEIDGVQDCFEFIETSVLLTNKDKGLSLISRLRAFDFNDINNTRMRNSISLVENQDLFESGVTLSFTLSNELDIEKNNMIQLTLLAKGKTSTVAPKNKNLSYVGDYSCRLNDYSSNTVLMSLSMAESILNTDSVSFGFYLNGNEKQIIRNIRNLDPDAEIITWQEYNKVIFSALVLEKAMVYLFLIFMFIILCVNLKNSTSRLINLKSNENAVLRAIGASERGIRLMYLIQGLFITILGELSGLVLSLVFIKNINVILSFADKIAITLFGANSNLSVYAFYTLIDPGEIILILSCVLVLSVCFVLAGCKKLFKQEIMEAILNVSY